jgi:hypothetical protein
MHLLKTTDHSIGRIATLVGYAGGITLHTLLLRRLGGGVHELHSVT